MTRYVVFNPNAVTPIITPRQAQMIVTLLPQAEVVRRLQQASAKEHVRHEVLVAWDSLAAAARLARLGGDVEAAMEVPEGANPTASSETMTTTAAGERLGLTRERVLQLLHADELEEAEDSTSRRRRVTRASVEAFRERRQGRTDKATISGPATRAELLDAA